MCECECECVCVVVYEHNTAENTARMQQHSNAMDKHNPDTSQKNACGNNRILLDDAYINKPNPTPQRSCEAVVVVAGGGGQS